MPPKQLGRFAERERARRTKKHKTLVDAAGKNDLPPAPKKRARPRSQTVGQMAEAQFVRREEQAYLPPNETISSSYAAIQKKRGKPDDLGVHRFTTAYNTRAEKAEELKKTIERSRQLHGGRAIQDAMEEAAHLSAIAPPRYAEHHINARREELKTLVRGAVEPYGSKLEDFQVPQTPAPTPRAKAKARAGGRWRRGVLGT